MNVRRWSILVAVLTGVVVLITYAQTGAYDFPHMSLHAIRKLAQRGNAAAEFELGRREVTGIGAPPDEYSRAARWFRKSALQGYAKAEYDLGVAYYYGYGVPREYKRAALWFRKAASQGYADAEYDFGLVNDYGQGVPQNHKKAVKWYRKAAAQGDAKAEYNLGYAYDTGEGVPQNYKRAVIWFRLSAEQGDAWAEYTLGRSYYYGLGVPRNNVLAYMLADLANRHGSKQGFSRGERVIVFQMLAMLEKQLSPANVREAQSLANNWKVGTPLPTRIPVSHRK